MLKKIVAVMGCTLMLSGVFAAQAGADAPVRFQDSVTFTDVNPCTGLAHDVTLNFDVSIHEHRNNFVVHVARGGSTSDGYWMINGNDSFIENKGGARGHFMDQWRGPDGAKFRVTGTFLYNANQDEVKVDRFALTCIGN